MGGLISTITKAFFITFFVWFLLLGLLAQYSFSIELRDLSLEYQRFHESGRFPEMPNHRAKEGLSLLTDVSLFGPLYWKGKVHSLTDDSQYRLIGLELEAGLEILDFEVFYHHHSQHLLEASHPTVRFPVSDSVGVRWQIAGSK